MTKTRWSHLAMTLLATAAVGCSGGASRFSPIAPSSVAEAPTPTPEGTAASWASTHGWSPMADGRVAVADGLLVEAVEAVGDVKGVCPGRTIMVRGVPVAVTPATVFAAPLSCESLTVGTTVKITGLLFYTPAGVSVSATELEQVGSGNRAPSSNRAGEKLSGEGVVGAVSGGCPSVTFVMMGYRVQTSMTSTRYENGDCSALREGAQIKIDVDKDASGTIVAERIEFLRIPGRRD